MRFALTWRSSRLGRVIAEQEFRLDSDTVRRPDVAFLRAEVCGTY